MPPTFSQISSDFLSVKSRSDLAGWLGVSERALRYILYKLPDERKYSTFEIKKRNGNARVIDAPSPALKFLQSKLAETLSEIAPPRQLAKGYVRERSIFDHAKVHRSKRWLVLADIKDFFPSINFGRVGVFRAAPFSFGHEVAVCLAQLCTKGGQLPQGAPTSPVISNIVCRRLDRELLELSKRSRCSVSRYADDVCFSTNTRDISARVADFVGEAGWVPGLELKSVFQRNGFQINPNKFMVRCGRERKLVTGLSVNSGVSIPRSWRRQLRSALHVIRKYGEVPGDSIVLSWRPAFQRGSAVNIGQVIRGKVRYAHWIDRLAGRGSVEALHRNYRAGSMR